MRHQGRFLAAVTTLAMAGLACSLPLFAPSTPPAAATLGQLYTAAAQTLAAAESQAATPTPITAPTAAFPTAAPSVASSTLAPVSLCDAAGFVKDVSIPDETTIDPGGNFTKTWRLRNLGTCTWTTAYALVFDSGSRMHAPSSAGIARQRESRPDG